MTYAKEALSHIKMKFLIVLSFFTSAIALATPPITNSNNQDSVLMSDIRRDVSDTTTRYVAKSLIKDSIAYIVIFGLLKSRARSRTAQNP